MPTLTRVGEESLNKQLEVVGQTIVAKTIWELEKATALKEGKPYTVKEADVLNLVTTKPVEVKPEKIKP